MEGLLTAEIKESLEEIVKQCFYNNRIADRIMSLLNVKFVMNNTEAILHKGYAHLMPVLADKITDYMAERDCTAIYGETPRGDQEYDTPLECFKEMLKINLDLESLVKDAIEKAFNQKDYATKIYLERFLNDLIHVTSDVLTLVDKAELYENLDIPMNWMRFDKDIKSFGIFGE